MAAKTSTARRDDPMREIDLILLEEVMQRRNFDAGRNARTVQIGSLMVVLLGLVAVFAHALVQDQRSATAAAGDKLDAAHYANFSPPTPIQ
jgi:hypothetical protein